MQIMQNVTLRQIAAKAGLSVMGVSKALRNSSEISESTKIKVRKIAEQLGYCQNRIASILSSGKTQIIGVLLPTFSGHHWSLLLDSIGMELRAHKYSMLPIRWSKNFNTDINDIKELLMFRPDGLIVSARFENGAATKFYSELVRKGSKIVFLSHFPQIKGASRVISDEKSGIVKAVEHLVSLGHKNILYIGTSIFSEENDSRVQGFLEAINELSTNIQGKDVIFGKLGQENTIIEEAVQFIKSKKVFTAAICSSDYLAMDIMMAMSANKSMGTPVFSAIGFGDVLFHPLYLKYPLTSISHKPEIIGNIAVKKLIGMIEKNEPPSDAKVPTELIIRDSVKNIN